MSQAQAIRVRGVRLYFLPVVTRVPLKFGPEVTTEVVCARVQVRVEDGRGRSAFGWGETPLSAQWTWPSQLTWSERNEALIRFTKQLADAWAQFDRVGDPLQLGHGFNEQVLPSLHRDFNAERGAEAEPMPWLSALVCSSLFDIAVHDAYGNILDRPIYNLYGSETLHDDLDAYLESASNKDWDWSGRFPSEFLKPQAPTRLRAWHLIGGTDALEEADFKGDEPDDGYPVLLRDWIRRDGLTCLKVKLRGNDDAWDYDRLVRVGRIAQEEGVDWLTADFNCTVTDPGYVNEILDRLVLDEPRTFGMILYVEQPFPYDLEAHPIDVRSVSARKPLFMDESAHDWTLVRLGRELGWTGVALKTCKTQTGALLSLSWAKAHGMTLMVQDLTNPMLAQIPHVQLAAHAGTIMGVETNGMQFYPEASALEARIHEGLYQRREGSVDWSTCQGRAGFGYRVDEIARPLPDPAAAIDG